MIAILCLAIAVGGDCSHGAMVRRHRVSVVEVNHFYDENGKRVFDQVIYYDWSPREGRFQVRDWRLLKCANRVPIATPWGGFSAVWMDGETLREVWTPSVRETWTQYDPELEERQVLPKEDRRLLK